MVAAIVMTVGTISICLAVLIPALPLLMSGSPLGPFVRTSGLFGTNSRIIIFTVSGLWGIATGWGLFRLKGWARISTLACGGVLVFIGAAAEEELLFLPIRAQTGVSANVYHFIASFFLLLFAVGVWWCCLFNTDSIQKAFRRTDPRADRSPRPVSISLIGWFLILSGCLTFVLALMGQPATLFSLMLSGKSAFLFCLVVSLVELYLGIGLLKLRALSRTISVYFFAFGLVNSAFFFLHPAQSALAAVGISSIPLILRPSNSAHSFLFWVAVIIAAVGAFVPVWFLVTRKSSFWDS